MASVVSPTLSGTFYPRIWQRDEMAIQVWNKKGRMRTGRRIQALAQGGSIKVSELEDGSYLYQFTGEEKVETLSADPSTAVSRNKGVKISEMRSSWGAQDASGEDFLYQLGQADLSMNVDMKQNSENLDSLFTGKFLGHQSDIADGTLRGYEFRSYNNIVGDYYIAPKFLDAVVMHIVKNFLIDSGAFDKSTKVPLILGIWGGKGQGKSFQTELAFKKLGVEPVVMSAGELESDKAGEPGRLIRDRYRKAAEMSKVRGKLSCLLINDLDAGVGHFENTQLTVNNQMVTGTLMSICDNPNKVPRYGIEWRDEEPSLQRIPIIVTGNDLSKVFAPLLRDGRMEKFYWNPTLEDLSNILYQMYKDDGLSRDDMKTILNEFPNQSLDFYGALRAATYDNQIRTWIKDDVIDGEISEENENLKELGRRLLSQESLPIFEPLSLHVQDLIIEGRRLVQEQDHVNSMRLSNEYLKPQRKAGKSIIGLTG